MKRKPCKGDTCQSTGWNSASSKRENERRRPDGVALSGLRPLCYRLRPLSVPNPPPSSPAQRRRVRHITFVKLHVFLREIGGIDDRLGPTHVQPDAQFEFV